MPISADPTTPDEVADVLDSYRRFTVAGVGDDLHAVVATITADPDSYAAEAVDYAADRMDKEISYDWSAPHPLRDAVYAAAGDWARTVTPAAMRTRIRPADLPGLVYAVTPGA